MKHFFTFILSFAPLLLMAEVITMDLTTATNLNGDTLAYSERPGYYGYDLTHVWEGTYSDEGVDQFIYTNDQHFMLSHMPSQNSYDGWSWEGFTLSTVSQDTANVFGCVANGGVAGVGSPYAIAYYSDWVSAEQGYSSNIILFDDEYYLEYVYICQNSNTMEAITNGNVYNARAFTEADSLTLIIAALNTTLVEIDTIHYHLAVNGEKNSGWVKVPLTQLPKAWGLGFHIKTTDMGQFGANTPMYFALDGLTINTDQPTSLPLLPQSSTMSSRKILHDGQLLIMHPTGMYNLFGRRQYNNL